MEKKRFLLVFLLSFGVLWWEEARDLIYIPIIFIVNSLVVFVNYPYLILISNSRPLYVEDLFVKDRNEIELEIPR